MKTEIKVNPPTSFPCLAIDSRDGSVVGLRKLKSDITEAVVLLPGRGERDVFSKYVVEGTWPYKFFPDELVLSNEHQINQEPT